MPRISSFFVRVSSNRACSFPVMALKLWANRLNSPLRRVETVTPKSPAATRADASMTSRTGPETDRARTKAMARATRIMTPTALRSSPRKTARSASMSFMNRLSRRAPTIRPSGLERDAHVHHPLLQGRARADGHPLLSGEGGLDLRAIEVVFHVPGVLLRIGQDPAGRVDDSDPRPGLPAVGRDDPAEVARPGAVEIRDDLGLEQNGHMLESGGFLQDVVLAHQRRREEHDPGGQEQDDGRVTREDPEEQRLFHSSSL